MEARGKKTGGKITNLVTPMRMIAELLNRHNGEQKMKKNTVFKLLGRGDPLKTQNSLSDKNYCSKQK